MNLNVDLFIQILPILGKGILGVFIVTAVIIALIYLMNKFTSE